MLSIEGFDRGMIAPETWTNLSGRRAIAALVRPKPHQVLLIRAMAATFNNGGTAACFQESRLHGN
jgi:hypothetical protein